MSSTSVLDYARLYGLSVHNTVAPLTLALNSTQLAFDDEDSFLESDKRLLIDCEQLLLDDKLQIDRGAITFLATCIKQPRKPDWSETTKEAGSAKDLRVELPMLMSDHVKDLRWFTKRPDLNLRLRQHVSSIDAEGIEKVAPQEFEDYEEHAVSLLREISDERLEVSATAVTFLCDCINKALPRDAIATSMDQYLEQTKVKGRYRIFIVIALADHRSTAPSSFSRPYCLLRTAPKMLSTDCHLCQFCSSNPDPTSRLMPTTF
jgi:hypothetical protein